MGQSSSAQSHIVCSHRLRDGSSIETYSDGRIKRVSRKGRKSTIKGTCVKVEPNGDNCVHHITNWSSWRCDSGLTNIITYNTNGTQKHILDCGGFSHHSLRYIDPVPHRFFQPNLLSVPIQPDPFDNIEPDDDC
jgi:hypothetical protein